MKHHSDRQDYYAKLARKDGYRSRSVYKLIEIQERFGLIKPGMVVVDLGSSPGGWTQVLADWIKENGQIVACDRLLMKPVQRAEFIQGDFQNPETLSKIQQSLRRPADIVVSDMAPDLTGDAFQDQVNMYKLLQTVTETLDSLLVPKGAFLCKAFHGSEFGELKALVKSKFEKVREIKPKSSRNKSNEVYLLALSYKLC